MKYKILFLFALIAVSSLSFPASDAKAALTLPDGYRFYPADYFWNVPVDKLPVDSNSSAYISGIGASAVPYPFQSASINIVDASTPKSLIEKWVPWNGTWDEKQYSDVIPYPTSPIFKWSGSGCYQDQTACLRAQTPYYSGGENVYYMVNPGTNEYWTIYDGRLNTSTGAWTSAVFAARFDLTSYALRPAGWPADSVSGISHLPGVVTKAEIESGAINHAIAVAVYQTSRHTYVWPARRLGGMGSQPDEVAPAKYPPNGQRFRLKASFDINKLDANGNPVFSPQKKVILTALKKYGFITLENTGKPNDLSMDLERNLGYGWDYTAFIGAKASDFEAVDATSLMIDWGSGKANYAVTDIVAPTRSSGQPSGSLAAGTTQTTISLTTNESATCKYSTTAGTAYASMTGTFTTTGGATHSKTIAGLSNGTSYTYYVRCTDSSNNVNTSDYAISFSVGSTSCNDCGLGTPVIAPTSPLTGQAFTITCPANNTGYDCINAYANGSSNKCTFSSYSGNNAIFNCTGLTAGSYTSKCEAVTGTSRNCCATSQTGSYSVTQTNSPVGYWKFDETSGTAVSDSSGNGNNGTIYGSPLRVTGRVNNALQFATSTGDYVNVGTDASLQITGAITAEAWIKSGYNGWNTILHKLAGSTNGYFFGTDSGGSLYFYMYSAGTIRYRQTGYDVTDGNWHHVAATYDGTKIVFYVDGASVNNYDWGSYLALGNDVSIPLKISFTGNQGFHGLIDEVKIYSRALSAAEVLADYNAVAGSTDTTPPSQITNLSASNITQSSVTLSWTAPGDDGTTGTATSYDIRYSTASITSSNWTSATAVSGEPTPSTSGTSQTFTVSGLAATTTYYFAIKAIDDGNNNSALSNVVSGKTLAAVIGGAIIIDHKCTDASKIPDYWIEQAKKLTIHYAHTSHGSQLMTGANAWMAYNPKFRIAINRGTTPGLPADTTALRVYDGTTINTYATPDLYYSATNGINSTNYIANTGLFQYSMFAWCYQVSDMTSAQVSAYLNQMDAFEKQHPGMRFIYMTGHVDTTGSTGNLHLRNEQIRAYCRANNKILYDFGDIGNYDPDGKSYLDLGNGMGSVMVVNECQYSGGNWCTWWVSANPTSIYSQVASKCLPDPALSGESCAHSNPLNCVLKGGAFWWMMARLAGWDGVTLNTPDTTPPSQITNLSASNLTQNSVTLSWTAPGDDGAAGTATSYDIRYSTASITSSNWTSATAVSGEPAPSTSGTSQTFTVTGLTANTTYYFAIKAIDDANNISNLSNVVSGKTSAAAVGGSHTVAGVQMFPADSVFNTPIDNLPVHSKSAEWINSQNWDVTIDGTRYTGPGILFNSWSTTNGNPINISNNAGSVDRSISFRYAYQSDFCPGHTYADWQANQTAYHLSTVKYRIPNNYTIESGADHHVYILNTDTKLLYEIFTLNPMLSDGTFTAQSGAIYDMTSNQLRGGTNNPQMDGLSYALPRAGAGAAGVPMMPLFVNYEDVSAGSINHALYVALPWTGSSYIWPARAAAPTTGGVNTVNGATYQAPPNGARVRLKASFDISGYPAQAKVVLTAMKKYGAIVGDNAFKPYENTLWRADKRVWWIWGIPNSNWDQTDMNWIQRVKSTDLEFVDESSLMIDSNSGQARQSSVPSDTTPPSQITNLSASNLTQSSVTINWTAPGDDGTVGTAAGYDIRYSTASITSSNWTSATQAAGEPSPLTSGTSQTFTVSGLAASTTYYFAIKAVDDSGNMSVLSNIASGKTLAAIVSDTTPPTLSGGSPSGALSAGTTQTTISLTTNETATCKYSVVSGTAYASMTGTFTNTGGTAHSKTITGLTNGTSYTYYVRCTDSSNNVNTSDYAVYFSVSSPSCVGSVLGTPVITPAIPIVGQTFTITCPTNASGYDCIDAYANGSSNKCTFSSYSGNNVIFNCTGLTAGSYTSRCEAITGTSMNCCADVKVNSYSMQTAASDITPPSRATNLSASDATQNSITLIWTAPGDDGATGAAARYDIRYFYAPIDESNWDLATQALNEPTPSSAGTTQSYTVTGLAENATYYFAIKAIDEAGNASPLFNLVSGSTVASESSTSTTPVTPDIASLQSLINQLLAQVAQLQAQLAAAQGTATVQYKFLNPLYLGLWNEDVQQLQIFLTDQGTAIYPEAKITGYYGLLTKKAVIRFQLKYNIVASEYSAGAGLVGIKTRAKINGLLGM